MATTATVPQPVATPVYTEIAACRMTGSERLVSILDLGTMPLSGVFPYKWERVVGGPVELVLCLDGGLVQLRQRYDPELMYGENYGYRSGLNGSMVKHLSQIATTLDGLRSTKAGDVILDIGSNDGTLLSCYPNRGQMFVGIDPTISKFRQFYPAHINRTIAGFFSERSYRILVGRRQAQIITSIAMLYDLDHPLDFMRSIASILAEDGLWYTEQSYLPALLDQCAYDTICHEHLEYYGLTQLQWMAERAGLRIISATPNATNGGSLAVTFSHAVSPYQADTEAIDQLLQAEAARGLDTPAGFAAFRGAVARHRLALPALIRSLRADGKTVFGYGASTKGNVLLHACGLTVEDLPCIADVNPDKHGRVTPGTHIPIVSEVDAKAQHPDYFLVMPWHFRDFIVEREQEFLSNGGRLIFPLPTIQIVEAQ